MVEGDTGEGGEGERGGESEVYFSADREQCLLVVL